MFLFINTISEEAIYLLFDVNRKEIDRMSLPLKGRESERFFLSAEEFLVKNNISFRDLRGIIAVNGPGGFTSMRIVTLAVNSIAFVHNIPLYPIDFFAFSEYAGASFPMLLKANRGEYLLKQNPEKDISIMAISEIPNGQYFGIGDENDFENTGISIQSGLDYSVFLRNYRFSKPHTRIDPIYVKKPNISIKSIPKQ